MMNEKQVEALKLALEALEVATTPLAKDRQEVLRARAAIREALAHAPEVREQPAPPPPPPECQTEAEKTAFAFGWWKALEQKRKVDSALDRMAENARELGLDYEPIVEQVEDSVGMGHGAWDMVEPKKLAKAFHEALAEPPCKTGSQCTSKCQQCEQPAQEPVAWINTTGDFLFQHPEEHGRENEEWFPLVHQNTSPPANTNAGKPWVGLTQQDIDIAFDDTQEGGGFNEFARAIEAKLRELNEHREKNA